MASKRNKRLKNLADVSGWTMTTYLKRPTGQRKSPPNAVFCFQRFLERHRLRRSDAILIQTTPTTRPFAHHPRSHWRRMAIRSNSSRLNHLSLKSIPKNPPNNHGGRYNLFTFVSFTKIIWQLRINGKLCHLNGYEESTNRSEGFYDATNGWLRLQKGQCSMEFPLHIINIFKVRERS